MRPYSEVYRWIVEDEWPHFRVLLGPVGAVQALSRHYDIPVSVVADLITRYFGENFPGYIRSLNHACS